MVKKELGSLHEVSLREIWVDEARDFTPWLAEQKHLDELADIVGINLVEPKTEVPVGGFSCDIVCKEEATDNVVIIENQLEDTNHDHLGKVITYAANLQAKYVIWIVKEARDEHSKAIEWLNENSRNDVSFFLVEIHAVRINDSVCAPLFKIIEEPNDFSKMVSQKQDQEITKTMENRFAFWSQLNDYIKDNDINLRITKPSYDHWHNFTIGSSNCHLSVRLIITGSPKIAVGLWITDDKVLFEKLLAKKNDIESALPFQITWDKKDNKKASSIDSYISGFSYSNSAEFQKWDSEICRRLRAFAGVLTPIILG